jgi:UDP-glucose 4-epimerase
MMFSVVTGGAGFIGSHLVDTLVKQGERVLVIDSLSAGSEKHLTSHLGKGKVWLLTRDLMDDGWQEKLAGAGRVYHLAADPDVRQSSLMPESQMRNNIMATYRVLEAMRQQGICEIVFTSTSTVYGEATNIPTPESYTPLEPISVYGASKLACEALISSYCHSFGMRGWIYRFANIIGERSGHGVIRDFIDKLRKNPMELEILGDGRQRKSYLGVHECVSAMLFAADHSHATVNTFNIGSDDCIEVTNIAKIVCEEMKLPDVQFKYTGGERGWVGDVPKMQLSVERLKSLGWHSSLGSRESVKQAVRAMLNE